MLTSEDDFAENPPTFKGNLFAPQKTMLAAMIRLENDPVAKVGDNSTELEWQPITQTRVARVAEKFSFGKTVLSLALVCAQKDRDRALNYADSKFPLINPILSYPTRSDSVNRAQVTFGGKKKAEESACFVPEIQSTYAKYLPITIVMAVSNIITQWEQNTTKFTDLKYYTIDNVYSVKRFEKMCRDGSIAKFDLVFIKAGKITSNYIIDGETPMPALAKNRSIIEAIFRILEGTCIARLLIDDYDTLKLGKRDCFIPAHFTWLISATRRITSVKFALNTTFNTMPVTSVEQFIEMNMVSNFPILGAALDDVINKTFSLQCSPEYVDEFINSTKVDFRRIEVKHGSFNTILRDLDISDEVIEMLNATAIKTATQSLNMNASSVGEVVMRIIGNKLTMLQDCILVLSRIKYLEELVCDENARINSNPTEIKKFKICITGADDAGFNAFVSEWAASYTIPDFEILKNKTISKRNEYEIMLNRMKDNIREKQCQCCMVPFESEDDAYILAECCQIVVCEMCIIRNKRLINKCPNCVSAITTKGLIRIGSELNIEEALSTDSNIMDIECGNTADSPLSYNPKLQALIQYITGEPIDCISSKYVQPFVRGLLDGKHDKPWPADRPKKFLIFTMFSESTNVIAQELERLNITYCIMQGTRDQKDECMAKMRSGAASIMLLHSPKNCAGLNMPFISNVVFYHNLLDNEVKSQVAARGQRLGREFNLEITEIFNADEHKKK